MLHRYFKFNQLRSINHLSHKFYYNLTKFYTTNNKPMESEMGSSSGSINPFEKFKLEPTFITELPIDPNAKNYINPNAIPSTLNKTQFISQLGPKPLGLNHPFKFGSFALTLPESQPFPKLVHKSKQCEDLIDLKIEKDNSLVKYLSGNELIPGTYPWAQCYVGHQFGFFAGRLGDGRALSLAELINDRGERWELQLKGSGETPYSRMGDGFAVLRSSVREYLCSEANAALSIPTTRALTLISTTQLVHREQLEPGAVVCRVAPSWLRFGNFQVYQLTKENDALKLLAEYAIKYHFPKLQNGLKGKELYREFYFEVARRTGKLVASWQANAFVHGVLNTDNMSILGLTLDYGPYGFMDKFDPTWTSNLSDHESRYSYENQPGIGGWNIQKFGEALQPIMVPGLAPIPLGYGSSETDERLVSEIVTDGVNVYFEALHSSYQELMSKKLGFLTWTAEDSDKTLTPLLELLEKDQIDYHRFFRKLSHLSYKLIDEDKHEAIQQLLIELGPSPNSLCLATDLDHKIHQDEWNRFLTSYTQRLQTDYPTPTNQIKINMLKNNPRFLPRNWVAQKGIDSLQKQPTDPNTFNAIFELCTTYAYSENEEIDLVKHHFITLDLANSIDQSPPKDLQELKCSCSS